MRDEQLFGLVAGAALLIWLLGRRMAGNERGRRRLEAVALGLVAAGILVALVQALLWYLA